MNLILKQEKFDTKRIKLKESKKCIKITYFLDHIYMIGLTIKLKNITFNENDNFIYIDIHDDKQLNFLKNVNSFISSKVDNYQSFLYNNRLKVKKHLDFKSSDDNNINIKLNNLKKIKDFYKVQIFTI